MISFQMQFYNIWAAKKHSLFWWKLLTHYGLFTCYFHQDDDAMKSLEALKFKFSTIKAATNKFSNANKLGIISRISPSILMWLVMTLNLLICDVLNCGQLEGLSLMKLGSFKMWYMIMLFRRSLSIFELCSARRVQGNWWQGLWGSKVGYFRLLDARKSLSMVYLWVLNISRFRPSVVIFWSPTVQNIQL